MVERIAAFVSRRWRVPQTGLRIQTNPLAGGLTSSVMSARIVGRRCHRLVPSQLVIKMLSREETREVAIYDALWRHIDCPPAVRVFGRDQQNGTTFIYLEHAQRYANWPWSDTRQAAAVCRELAALHDSRSLPRRAFQWSYERDLQASAAETLADAVAARDRSRRGYWRRIGDLSRVVEALPRLRHYLLSRERAVLHGDVHPGNVILRERENQLRVVLIDWARARVGSPMEDIASWLHSLGCWEPEARRRHDTLMRAYLHARRTPRVFSRELRTAYWFASVSNGLSGAIRYHLAVLSDAASIDAARHDSQLALVAWERVVRRAAVLVKTSLGR
jgi:aminoglycoside phosphotransferase (APT) family kinase protein